VPPGGAGEGERPAGGLDSSGVPALATSAVPTPGLETERSWPAPPPAAKAGGGAWRAGEALALAVAVAEAMPPLGGGEVVSQVCVLSAARMAANSSCVMVPSCERER
jgi:hypothetical protein